MANTDWLGKIQREFDGLHNSEKIEYIVESITKVLRAAYWKGYSRGSEESRNPDEMPYMGPDRSEEDIRKILEEFK